MAVRGDMPTMASSSYASSSFSLDGPEPLGPIGGMAAAMRRVSPAASLALNAQILKQLEIKALGDKFGMTQSTVSSFVRGLRRV